MDYMHPAGAAMHKCQELIHDAADFIHKEEKMAADFIHKEEKAAVDFIHSREQLLADFIKRRHERNCHEKLDEKKHLEEERQKWEHERQDLLKQVDEAIYARHDRQIHSKHGHPGSEEPESIEHELLIEERKRWESERSELLKKIELEHSHAHQLKLELEAKQLKQATVAM